MSTPTVTEIPLRLEPVTADDFISDLAALPPVAPAAPARSVTAPRPARIRRRRGLRLRIDSPLGTARPLAA